jgi:cytochrome c-type biogenesis protein CcmH/NrfG
VNARQFEQSRYALRHRGSPIVRFDHEAPQCGTPAQHALCCRLARDASFASLLYAIAVIQQQALEAVRRRRLRPLDPSEVDALIKQLRERAR